MNKSNNIIIRFFGVIIRGQTYLNILYLLLALPFGVFYYVFLVGGISLGLPLVIVLIGVLILIVVFAGWVAFIAFERQLAVWLLRVDVPPYIPENTGADGHSNWISGLITNRVTWTGLVFLFIKLPLSLVSFVVMVGLFAITVQWLSAPFIFQLDPWNKWTYWLIELTGWQIDQLWKTLILLLLGILMIFISLHIINLMAWIWGRLAYLMLGRKAKPTQISEPIRPGMDQEPAPEYPAPIIIEPKQVEPSVSEVQAEAEVPELHESLLSEIEIDEQSQLSDVDDSVSFGEAQPLVTPPPDDVPEQDSPIITPPPTSPQTQMIDEDELLAAKSSLADRSPPEWLLEEESPGNVVDEDSAEDR